MKTPGHERLEGIEHLRAVAILFTLIAHSHVLFPWNSPLRQWLSSRTVFWDGVDLFLCISGFVIMRGLVRRPFNLVEILAFWVRRAFRILPSAWFWLAFGLVGTIAFNHFGSFGSFENNLKDAGFAIANLANFRLTACQQDGSCGFNPVYWSLSLEEQFYLLLPFVMWLSGRRLLAVCAVLWAVSNFVPRPLPGPLWQVRADAVLAGVMLALAYIPCKLDIRVARLCAIALIGFLCLGPGFSIAGKAPIFPGATQMVSVACVLLVWIASSEGRLLGPTPLLERVTLWIGTRSYALYLVHIPIAAVVAEAWKMAIAGHVLGPTIVIPFAVTELLTIILAAELNYRFIETPLRSIGKGVSERLITAQSRSRLVDG
jgi:peptidoglycan/LPS O-acetylase OafA/YrhL